MWDTGHKHERERMISMTTMMIEPAVQERLKQHMNPGDRLILDFDDGVGRYSKVGVCSLDVSFRLLIVADDTLDSVYDTTLDSPMGEIWIKGYAANFVDEAPKLSVNKFGLITLTTATGTIDSNVAVLDHPQVVSE